MSHTVHNKKKLLARVRRIKGQTGALESALEQETDCAAILQQIAAMWPQKRPINLYAALAEVAR